MTKIMLVEDDNNLREIYGARLSAEGYEIVFAKDGEEALALAVKEKPELIVSDVMMPKISGFDMLDILRNAPETQNTKVIMMTALSQTEDQERAKKLGADKYLVKSQVTLEDVVKTVKEVLGDASSAETTPAVVISDDMVPAPPIQQVVEETPVSVNPATPEPQEPPAEQPPEQPVEPSTPPVEEPIVEEAPEQVPSETPQTTEPANEPVTSEEDPITTEPETQTSPIIDQNPVTEPAETAQPIVPEVVSNPVADPTSQQSSVDDNSNVTTPDPVAPTPITVTLPDDDSPAVADASSLPGVSQQADDTSAVQPAPTDTPEAPVEAEEPLVAKPTLPDTTPDEPASPSIGPNLNEALEDVENEIQKEMDSIGNGASVTSTAPTVANGGEINSVITPDLTQQEPVTTSEVKSSEPTQATETEANEPNIVPDPVVVEPTQPMPEPVAEPTPEAPTNTGGIVEDQNGKKVINPINDLNSKPDLNELLAKEQAKAGLETPVAQTVVAPTETTPPPESSATTESPTIVNSEIKPAPAPDPNSSIAL